MCDRPDGQQDFLDFLCSSGVAHLDWRDLVMLVVGFAFIYVAIRLKREPYVLLPIGLGIILTNLPEHGMTEFIIGGTEPQASGLFGVISYHGLSHWNILPPVIFLGLGAMTDFAPVMANPKTLLLGAAAQVGIFVAFWGALATGFDINEAAAIGIIGGADGPTTIFLSAVLAPNILGITAVIAYTYMASVVFIQPPLMKLLTTRKERQIVMRPLREVSDIEKMLFPAIAMIVIILLVPKSAPLIAMFMIGNLFRESGVVPRLTSASTNELLNVATIFLMITVGTKLNADLVFKTDTLLILGLGLLAFSCGTIGGVLFAKLMNLVSRDKINPLIGSAGVSAVPMAARISHSVGQEANPANYLLSHAMGPNVAGVIGSAVIAGVFVSLIQV
jgi:sodium ion-translocating decarboxylase beta subunit